MSWFYAIDTRQVGPVTDSQLEQLIESGQINPQTLVWREGMSDWQPLHMVQGMPAPVPGAPAPTCAECGRPFAPENLIQLNRRWICAQCKPLYLQKMSEGVATPNVIGNMWRKGKQLVTFSETPFPDRCVKCNAPANGYRLKRTLYWHPPAYYFLLLVNLLIFAIVAMAVRKKAILHVGLCEEHRAQRRNVIWIAWLGALASVALALIGGIQFSSGMAVFAGIILCLGFMIYGAIKGPMVAAAKITKENVRLKGVHSSFLADLPEWMGD